MPNTCKAAVFMGAQKPLEIQEFPVPEVEPGAVLLQMQMAAVCGTDVHAWHNPDAPFPAIFGHENIGIIAQMGRGVTLDALGRPVKEGDRVLFSGTPCGHCYYCTISMPLFCETYGKYGLEPMSDPPVLNGGFAQYVYLKPTPWLLRIPDDVSSERALMSLIGNQTTMNAIERAGGIRVGETVVVQGSGPVGMGALNQAKLSGASLVVVVGAPANRLELAKEMGADMTVDIADFPEPGARVQRVLELVGDKGADVVVEASGGKTAFQEGLEMVRMSGKYVVVGQYTDYGPLPVNPALIVRKSLYVTGVVASTPQTAIRSLESMSTAVKYPVEKLITHHYPLEDVNEAFRAHDAMEAMIPVLLPNG
jgi:threonine dehydrogenase-like Zn-dependent dehydrogenase